MSSQVNGMIAYFGLEDWWLTEFEEAERQHIEKNGFGDASLTQGKITATSQTAPGLIRAMASFWQPTAEDVILIERLNIKAKQLTGETE
ncbi:hypothetical protein JWZ98_11215 [Methylomonas sp. EFPC1]|uniref:hypothetical protein n=1 Tax=Methylomonas sp. EFPC1 TaxID=2812647 RepID=UPI001967B280|nr:hypothetical protein [Methylomonas sp. EFPC1]QSB03446.1 hypothetical protein JWZ98_11215 [Methylomonas sp. EFPC1]